MPLTSGGFNKLSLKLLLAILMLLRMSSNFAQARDIMFMLYAALKKLNEVALINTIHYTADVFIN